MGRDGEFDFLQIIYILVWIAQKFDTTKGFNLEDFSITTRLSEKEYSKVMFLGLYRKPGFIAAAIFGIYFLVTIVLDHFKIIAYYSETPYLEIFLGLFLLLFPSLIVLASVRQFRSNPSFQHEMTFTFGEDGYKVQGLNFKGEFQWAHIIKRKEIKDFLILYHNKRAGNFIDKTKLTTGQLQFIKSKVKGK